MGVWDIYFTYRFITQLEVFRVRDELREIETSIDLSIMTSFLAFQPVMSHLTFKVQ